MSKRKQCGTVKRTNTYPYHFLDLLSEKKQVDINYLKNNYPHWKKTVTWKKKLEQWQKHFINYIVDGKRYWITIEWTTEENAIVTLKHIQLDVPEGWKVFKFHPDCYNPDGSFK